MATSLRPECANSVPHWKAGNPLAFEVLEVSGDVELLRASDVLVESPLDETFQHYIQLTALVFTTMVEPHLPLSQ